MSGVIAVTIEELRERLDFCPSTGLISWKKSRYRNRIGQVTNSLDSRGYVQIKVCGRVIKGHRLAWALHYGEWPNQDIDHINGVRHDNRIENLREVSNALNCQNKRAPLPGNKTGFLGVTYQAGAYRATVTLNRKQHHLGRFATAEAAHAAYLAGKRKLHEGCSL